MPLIPTNQSASDRQRAASARGINSSSERSLLKPSRIAAGVIDCNHRRSIFCWAFACCVIKRKISSPSRPASQALMMRLTSLRLMSFCKTLRRDSVLAMGRKSKCGGMTGKLTNDHFPRLTSYSSGAAISRRWPTADEIKNASFSKYSSCLVKPPRALAISFATDGFSAIMSAFGCSATKFFLLLDFVLVATLRLIKICLPCLFMDSFVDQKED